MCDIRKSSAVVFSVHDAMLRFCQAYASILGAVTLSASRWKNLASGHLATVLLVPWAVYIYRDVWPLATYHLVPADGAEGALLWAEVGVLSLAAIVVPLAIPTEYVPYDPEVLAIFRLCTVSNLTGRLGSNARAQSGADGVHTFDDDLHFFGRRHLERISVASSDYGRAAAAVRLGSHEAHVQEELPSMLRRDLARINEADENTRSTSILLAKVQVATSSGA